MSFYIQIIVRIFSNPKGEDGTRYESRAGSMLRFTKARIIMCPKRNRVQRVAFIYYKANFKVAK